jgi:hypothetical protein
MRIAICSSMVFSERMLEMKARLEGMGHTAFVSDFARGYAGRSEAEKEALTVKDKNENDAIRRFWEKIRKSDAVLVLNYDRKGVRNYIGGNTFLEMGFAHVLRKRIFLLNPVPEIGFYKSEIEAMEPVILNGDLSVMA